MTDDERDQAKTDHASINRRGEDVSGDENEAGREQTGTQGATDRPVGTSTTRDVTSVNPSEITSHDDDSRSPAG
ncbi:MAG: hypothetical protein H0U52_01960 [Chloroflexi bacterium]|nr:hypothetical protein [Chloroflexota bacterium]